MDRIDDGFDVHHMDGDPNNDSPDNLVLIETSDHTCVVHRLKMIRKIGAPRGRRPSNLERDAAIYAAKTLDNSWRDVARVFGISGRLALQAGRRHAIATEQPWPIDYLARETDSVLAVLRRDGLA